MLTIIIGIGYNISDKIIEKNIKTIIEFKIKFFKKVFVDQEH